MDYLSGIRLTEKEEGLYVECCIDGVEMKPKMLSPKDAVFIGKSPYSQSQKEWAARMAFRNELKRNQRVSELKFRKDKLGVWHVRCKIDGRQQLSSELSPKMVTMLKKGLVTERELVNTYYRSILMDNIGQVIEDRTSRNMNMNLSKKMNNDG